MPAKRPSGDHIVPNVYCPIAGSADDIDELRRRMASIDGNSVDPNGGRVGRMEAEIKSIRADMEYSNRLLITTLLASLGTLITAIIGVALVVKR